VFTVWVWALSSTDFQHDFAGKGVLNVLSEVKVIRDSSIAFTLGRKLASFYHL